MSLGNLAAAAQALSNANAATQQNHQSQPATQGVPSWGTGATPVNMRANMEEIQQTIRSKRKALGWSQRELAHRCGMSQGTITRAERHGWISLNCLISIALALNEKLLIGK